MNDLYKVENEELHIYSCCIADLTMQQESAFLSQLEYDAKICTLTMFFDKESGDLILNRNHRNYQMFLDMAEAYLSVDDAGREALWKNAPESINETLQILENCRQYRLVIKEIGIVAKQTIECVYKTKERMVFEKIFDRCSCNNELDLFFVSMIYNYGVIQGKRMERARRKGVIM